MDRSTADSIMDPSFREVRIQNTCIFWVRDTILRSEGHTKGLKRTGNGHQARCVLPWGRAQEFCPQHLVSDVSQHAAINDWIPPPPEPPMSPPPPHQEAATTFPQGSQVDPGDSASVQARVIVVPGRQTRNPAPCVNWCMPCLRSVLLAWYKTHEKGSDPSPFPPSVFIIPCTKTGRSILCWRCCTGHKLCDEVSFTLMIYWFLFTDLCA